MCLYCHVNIFYQHLHLLLNHPQLIHSKSKEGKANQFKKLLHELGAILVQSWNCCDTYLIWNWQNWFRTSFDLFMYNIYYKCLNKVLDLSNSFLNKLIIFLNHVIKLNYWIKHVTYLILYSIFHRLAGSMFSTKDGFTIRNSSTGRRKRSINNKTTVSVTFLYFINHAQLTFHG